MCAGNVKLQQESARGVNNLPKGTVEILDCIVTVMTRLFIQGNLLGHNSWNCRTGEDGLGVQDTSHVRRALLLIAFAFVTRHK